MNRLLILFAAVTLSGCATFENHVYCSPDKTRMAFVSWYASVGIAAKVADEDAQKLCGAR